MGEDELEVVLAQRLHAAQQHRDDRQRRDQRAPRLDVGEPGREAQHEVDAGLHHRRGVQVGADRRRRGHRRGQPEVERHQRGLGDRPDQHADDPGGHRRGGRGGAREVGHEVREPRGARRGGQHHQADEHRQAARRGDDERLHRRRTARPLVRVVPDEQEGEDGRQLPAHVEHEDVVGPDEREHRAGEGGEHPGEPPEPARALREVARAVQEHEGPDAGDQQREGGGQRVEAHRDVDAEGGDPRDLLGGRGAREHRGQLRQDPDEGRGGDQGQHRERASTEHPDQARRGQRRHRVRSHQHQHACCTPHCRPGPWRGASFRIPRGGRVR